jgi:hypothetical protein
MPDLRYKDVELALAVMFSVGEDEIGAFRARLRHLRNIGVPRLPKVGSGTQITYTRRHAFELAIAFQLGVCGVSPKYIKALVETALRDFGNFSRRSPGKRIVLKFVKAGAGASVSVLGDSIDLTNSPFNALTIIDLTALNQALPPHWK